MAFRVIPPSQGLLVTLILTTLVLSLSGEAVAQRPLDTSATSLPPGHPPVPAAGSTAPAPPPARPAPPLAPSVTAMPPGHPPVAATSSSAPSGQPSPAVRPNVPPGHPAPRSEDARRLTDQSTAAPAVPPGVLEVETRDHRGQPLPGAKIQLKIVRQSIPEGNPTREVAAVTDAAGRYRFTDLAVGTRQTYQVLATRDSATYSVHPFTLTKISGHRVVLHVYPVVEDIGSAEVGLRGFVYVEIRDDVFQFEAAFRILNIGSVTWTPKNVQLALPKGWKGFTTQDSEGAVRFVSNGAEGVRLDGAVSPGQHDAVFRFQVPNEQTSTANFEIEMPPNIAEMRVLALSARGLSLKVDDFEPARTSSNPDGQKILATGKQFRRGQLERLRVTLNGIPTLPTDRWYVLALAGLIALGGLAHGLTRNGAARRPIARVHRDAEQARELLLSELVALERAFSAEEIGQKTYRQAKKILLDALTRLQLSLINQSPSGSSEDSSQREGTRD